MQIPPAANLLLIRHGDVLRAHDAGGRFVESLSEAGTAQAAAIGAAIAATEGPRVLYCSPAERSRATARIIAAAADCPVHIDDDLRGLSLGIDRSGGRRGALAAWTQVQQQRDRAAWPGGESLEQLRARALGAVRGALRANPGARVILVSHRAWIEEVAAALAGVAGRGEAVRHGDLQGWQVDPDADPPRGRRVDAGASPS